MPRIIFIGECTLDVIFPPDDRTEWPLQLSGRPAGRLLNAAAMLAAAGSDVTVVGEAARDRLGDLLVGYLRKTGVDTHCIDRFSDGGITSSNFIFPTADGDAPCTVIPNRRYPSGENFNATWPRIDAGDIVVFGGYFAISDRSRQQLTEILQFASDRHAIIVYLPGFAPAMVPRITKVMPAILENLEVADVVVTDTADLRNIFGAADSAQCYRQNIRFYCRTMIDIDPGAHTVSLYHHDLATTSPLDADASTLEAHAAALAMAVRFMAEGHFTRAALDGMTADACRDLSDAVAAAANTGTL